LVDPRDPRPLRTEWCSGLPELHDDGLTLRELHSSDARSLVGHLNRPAVLQYIASCPATAEGFVRFIRWAHDQRRRGVFACYGIVPCGQAVAVGVIQFWPIEPDFSTAEWGFALGDAFWGTGLFARSARLVLDAMFSQLGVYRLEARSADDNTSGNRALEHLGAKREGVLREGFRKGSFVRDHVMWSILAADWHARRTGERNGD
jgi:RimJ/RimL family protein N-acetyltransferase